MLFHSTSILFHSIINAKYYLHIYNENTIKKNLLQNLDGTCTSRALQLIPLDNTRFIKRTLDYQLGIARLSNTNIMMLKAMKTPLTLLYFTSHKNLGFREIYWEKKVYTVHH